MPTYEYQCSDPKCSYSFETEQRITEKPLEVCSKCCQKTLNRLIGNTSFVLKGGGWYAEGYSKKQSDA